MVEYDSSEELCEDCRKKAPTHKWEHADPQSIEIVEDANAEGEQHLRCKQCKDG